MASVVTPVSANDQRRDMGRRRLATRYLQVAMEGIVLAVVCLSPWALGAVELKYEFLLDVAVAVLMALWGVWMLLEGRPPRLTCPVAICLVALILLGVGQMIPLPRGLLARISPATEKLYAQLLPRQPEVLPLGEPRDDPQPPAGSTLSVYPGVTRTLVVRYLTILLLFSVVSQAVASPSSLKRLSLAALLNGSLLALFGLVQFFSTDDPGTIYWTIPTAGSVFGPYVNRNHFAFYANICLSLGAGLLVGTYGDRVRGPVRPGLMDEVGSFGPRSHRGVTPFQNRSRPFLDLLRNPWTFGIIFALSLMVSSVIFCLSRGGFLALLGGSLLGLAISGPRIWRSMRGGGPLFLTLAIVLALLSWFGYDQIATRLASFHDGKVLNDPRLGIWSRTWPLVKDFPVWGLGDGTYELADRLHRTDAAESETIYDHAHNDYLEVLVEGGVAQLLPVAVAVVLIFRFGLRAVRSRVGTREGGLVLGALVGFATVAIHSFTDFGLHIPANAVMATVLCAHLCALGYGDGESSAGQRIESQPVAPGRPYPGVWVIAPAVGAIAILALGLVPVRETWRKREAQQYRLDARDPGEIYDRASVERKVALLENAARLVPEYAGLQAEVARSHFEAYEEGIVELAGGQPGEKAADSSVVERLRSDHLVPALRHLLRSRDLCPVSAEAHMDIAANVQVFEGAEPRENYLDRAKLLAPDDPSLWYRCGLFELADGHPDRAWASWRRSLELSDLHLPDILDRSAGILGPRDLLYRVLPDRPVLLVATAAHLHPGSQEGRRPFLERALALLEERPEPKSAGDLHLKATIDRTLGRPLDALASLRAALARNPSQLEWRRELAEVFYENGQYTESRSELLTILGLHTGDAWARELLDKVTRKIAEGG